MDKQIREAEALASLKESEGWQIIQAWLDEAIDLTKHDVFQPKKTKNWNDYLHQRATHNAYVKLLFAIDQKIQSGIKAKDKQQRG